MKNSIFRIVLMCALLTGASAAHAKDSHYPEFDFKGLIFGDAYYVPSHHLEEGDGAAGLVMRRAYLTMDVDFSENWFGRARIEINQSGEFETYDFEADWKDLYLGADLGRHRVIGGLTATPTFDLIEGVWGARYLARTPMDMQGIASRDTGIYAKGPMNSSGSLSYRAMYAFPLEFGAESNPNDQFMAAFSWSPNDRLVFDFYGAYEKRDENKDRTTMQAFMGYETDLLRWGLQYSKQDRETDPDLELASGFLVTALGEKSSVIGRIDRLIQPSRRGDGISYIPFDPSAPATMYIAAYEYRWLPNLTLTPNFVLIDYDRNDEGIEPTTDLHLRLTVFFRF